MISIGLKLFELWINTGNVIGQRTCYASKLGS